MNLLVGWAPALFEACMDQLMLSDPQKVQPSGAFQQLNLYNYSAKMAVEYAASRKWPECTGVSFPSVLCMLVQAAGFFLLGLALIRTDAV